MPIFPYNGIWPRIAENVFIAPGAMIIGNVTLGEYANVWFNAVIRADTASIVIGPRTNIQDNVTLHVDSDAPLVIGEGCTIGHNAVVHGAMLGDHVLVGMNAVVLSRSRVGSDTVIGAHALIGEGKQISSGVLVVGLPARVVRSLTDQERERLQSSAAHYVELAQKFSSGLQEEEPIREATQQ